MKTFKFFQRDKCMSELYGRPINDIDIITQGWNANRNNLPPGQCPYNFGTRERAFWMDGWSARENREPAPIRFNNSNPTINRR